VRQRLRKAVALIVGIVGFVALGASAHAAGARSPLSGLRGNARSAAKTVIGGVENKLAGFRVTEVRLGVTYQEQSGHGLLMRDWTAVIKPKTKTAAADNGFPRLHQHGVVTAESNEALGGHIVWHHDKVLPYQKVGR
jgi:hypothetical protein